MLVPEKKSISQLVIDDTNCRNGGIWKKAYTQLVLGSINCRYAGVCEKNRLYIQYLVVIEIIKLDIYIVRFVKTWFH